MAKANKEIVTAKEIKYEEFLSHYLSNNPKTRYNATQSYLQLYPNASYNLARTDGSRYVASTYIQGRLAKFRQSLAEKIGVTEGFVLSNAKEVVERCMNPDDFKEQGAINSLKLLGSYHAMWVEKKEVDHHFSVENKLNELPPREVQLLPPA